MPVTTRVAPVEVKSAPLLGALNSTTLLQSSCPSLWQVGNSILDSSFGDNPAIQSARNGFVSTALDAYLQHNHLILRPEDVWFAILIQFSFYVNHHSEKLRKYFVNHAGKKKLEILQDELNVPAFVLEMTELIAQNVKDPSLREWIMPDFTTTTGRDKVTAAIIMMGTMQKYFAYFLGITCGIPSVTLLGDKGDWENILERVQFLNMFGAEHEELLIWNSVLTGVVTNFIRTFEAPDSPSVVKFWQRAVHQYSDDYSGEKLITGWLLAFCFWNADGKPLVVKSVQQLTEDWRQAVKLDGQSYWLDGVRLGALKWNEVPAGYAHVPVHFKNYITGEKFMTKAIAGSVGWEVVDSETIFPRTRGKRNQELGESGNKLSIQLGHNSQEKRVSAPSASTASTLVNGGQAHKPNLLQQIFQKILCFRSDTDNCATDPMDSNDVVNTKAAAADDLTSEHQGSNKDFSSSYQKYYQAELSQHAPQISDLSELEKPWAYEAGGKNDSLQPVTGWWLMKTVEGQYGKDADYPEVVFDSDDPNYDEDLALNGYPLKDEL